MQNIQKKTTNGSIENFIKEHEGLVLETYPDIYGFATIGYGHKLKTGENFLKTTIQEAEALFLQDMAEARMQVDYWSNEVGFVWDKQCQYDALVSVAFNGSQSAVDAMCDIMGGMDVYTAFTRGETDLFNRRHDEAHLYLYGNYSKSY